MPDVADASGSDRNPRSPSSPRARTTPAGPPRKETISPATASSLEALLGTTWRGYEIVDEVGRGGMAVVYRARQTNLDRDVAIKFLYPQGEQAATLVERFEQEARTIAGLRHPNIVTVLDFGLYEGLPYLVMEFVSGETLETALQQPMPIDRAQLIASQVASALDYAHGLGIVHRDVKPSNILLAQEDWALLSDFGIAKAVESTKQLTEMGMVVGTPGYMSPEQARGWNLDGRSDIYALGVVLYEMLTGRPPFTADTPISLLLQHVSEPIPSPRGLNPKISQDLENIVVRATAKKPDERFGSGKELSSALESLRVRPRKRGFVSRKRRADKVRSSAKRIGLVVSALVALATLIRGGIEVRDILAKPDAPAEQTPTAESLVPQGIVTETPPATPTSVEADAATTPLQTAMGRLLVDEARAVLEACPPPEIPGPCSKTSGSNRLIVLVLKAAEGGDVALNQVGAMEAHSSLVTYEGGRAGASRVTLRESTSRIEVIYGTLPASGLNGKVLLEWPDNPPLRLSVKS